MERAGACRARIVWWPMRYETSRQQQWCCHIRSPHAVGGYVVEGKEAWLKYYNILSGS